MADLRNGTASDHTQQMVTLNSAGLLADGHDAPIDDSGLDTAAVGEKTVTNTPAEVFAGTTAKSGRRRMLIKVGDSDIRIRIGTSTNNLERDGMPIEPGTSLVVAFNADRATSLYAVSEGAHVPINVFEY